MQGGCTITDASFLNLFSKHVHLMIICIIFETARESIRAFVEINHGYVVCVMWNY